MSLTVYQFAWNEAELIGFIHTQWKKNIPNCELILLDNNSTDSTVNQAVDLGYEGVFFYHTQGFDDGEHMKLSNNLPCEPKELVAICDMDEVCMVTQEQLEEEIALETTVIRFEGWNVFRKHYSGDTIGTRAPRFDKFIMFNHDKVKMNFGAGRHECYPKGEVKYSKKVYKLFHYGMWDLDYWLKRREMYMSRWSEKNLKMNWGLESRLPKEQLIEKYNKQKEKAIKIC